MGFFGSISRAGRTPEPSSLRHAHAPATPDHALVIESNFL
jgi:hypothetical protein